MPMVVVMTMVHSGDSRKPALKLTMDCLENEVLRRTPEAGNDQEEGKDDADGGRAQAGTEVSADSGRIDFLFGWVSGY